MLEGLTPPIEVVGPLLEEEASAAHRRWAALAVGADSALGGDLGVAAAEGEEG